MTENIDILIEDEMNFWDSKEEIYEKQFVCCEADCGCVNQCKNELMQTCNCHEREDDVCPKCMDKVLDSTYKDMTEGTAGKPLIDYVIELKTILKSCMDPDSRISKTLDREIQIFKILRENQKE